MKKKIFILLGVVILMCGCGIKVKNKSKSLDEVLNSGNYVIVDVRTDEEYSESHVKGAINIPYDTIDKNVNLDKDKTIIVYCRSGRRSGIAKDTLNSLGYDVLDLGAFESIALEKE